MTGRSFFHATLCCLSTLMLLGHAQALDLTPHPDTRRGNEGPPTPILTFTDGSKRIAWTAPHDWLPDGGGKSLSLSGPGAGGAWMKLLVVPIKNDAAQPVTDPSASADDQQAWAKQYMPEGAQNVVFVKMVASPFTVCTHPSTEYLFTFVRYGSRESISISAVDFSDTERLVVIFSSDMDNFEKTRQMVIGSMFTWQYM